MKSLIKTLRRSYYPTSVYQITDQPAVFFEVAGESVVGKVKVRLFENLQPEAAENFRKMCEGFVDKSGKKVSYKGVKFVNVMKNFFMETEEVRQTIFGSPILHENYDRKFDRPGLVGLSYDVKGGKEESTSGFFISLKELPNLTNHVVIGEVYEGLDVLQTGDDRQELLEIKNCGFLETFTPHEHHENALGDGRKPWKHPGDEYIQTMDTGYPAPGGDHH
jgi:cyclophilin family peptidyl-prolyl cis-trans isomerase